MARRSDFLSTYFKNADLKQRSATRNALNLKRHADLADLADLFSLSHVRACAGAHMGAGACMRARIRVIHYLGQQGQQGQQMGYRINNLGLADLCLRSAFSGVGRQEARQA